MDKACNKDIGLVKCGAGCLMQGYGAVLGNSLSKETGVARSRFRQRLVAF